MARGRSPWGFVLICVAATFTAQREIFPFRTQLRLQPPRLAPRADGRPLDLPGPVRRFRPAIHAGARLTPTHHGSAHPARAALSVGAETWVATPSGVLRFDDQLWRSPATARPIGRLDVRRGLPAVQVHALAIARAGSATQVSIATDAGLVRTTFEGGLRFVQLAGQRVTALAPGYVGTWRGLYRRQPLAIVRGSEGMAVSALLRCGPDLYVGTHDRGLLLLRGGRLQTILGVPPTRVGALAGCHGAHPVWAGTVDGLFRVEGDRAVARPYRRHVTTLLARRSTLLFGTFGEGVLRLEPDGTTRVLLPGERVSLLHARPGALDLLVGTDSALLVLRPDGSRSALPLDGPPPGLVTAIAPARDALWVGTFDGGLAMLRAGRWERRPIFDDRITALQLDAGRRLWVGTAAGLAVERDARLEPVRDPRGWLTRHVAALRRQGSHLWVAVHPGLVVIDTAAQPLTFRYFGAAGKEGDAGLIGPTVYGVAFASSGIWIGTDDGLSVMTDEQVRSLTDLGGVLPDNWINDVRAAGDVIYVLTLRSGLLRVDPHGTQIWDVLDGRPPQRSESAGAPRIWTTRRFMTSPSVLLPVGGALLYGTNAAGIVVAPAPSRRGPGPLRTYGPAQGLSSAMVAALAYEPETDRLWVGGSGGIDRIDRASVLLALDRSGAARSGMRAERPRPTKEARP